MGGEWNDRIGEKERRRKEGWGGDASKY